MTHPNHLLNFISRLPTKSFQSVPGAFFRGRLSRVKQADLVQCETHPPEIAGSTGKHYVLQLVVTATGMRQYVIVLRPHRLKSSMLRFVRVTLGHRFRIGGADHFPYFRPYHRHAAEPAMVTIPCMDLSLFCRGGHAYLYPQLFRAIPKGRMPQGDIERKGCFYPRRNRSIPGFAGYLPTGTVHRQSPLALVNVQKPRHPEIWPHPRFQVWAGAGKFSIPKIGS